MINRTQPSSRDSALLILCFAILLAAATLGWASQQLATPTGVVLLGIVPVQPVLIGLHVAVLGLASLGLLVSVGYGLFHRRWLPARVTPILQHPAVGQVSLAAITALPLAHILLNRSRLQPVLTVGVGLAVGLLLLNLLYDRSPIDARRTIQIGAWAAGGILAVEAFGVLQGWSQIFTVIYRLRLPVGAAYAAPLRLVFLALAMLFIAGPLALISAPLRRRADTWNRQIAKLPLGVLLAPALAALAGHVAIWIGHRAALLILVNRVLVIAALLAVLPLTAKQEDGTTHPASLTLSPERARWLWWLIAGATCLIVIPVAAAWVAKYSVDSLAYLQIARDYAFGQSAVRGVWSPLISWLLVPAYWLHLDPLAAQRALTALMGLAWLVLADRLARQLDLSDGARLAVDALMALFFLKYAFWPLGNDTLAAVLLLLYLAIVTHRGWTSRPVFFGLAGGVIGAAAAYARAFSLPFIAAHLVLSALLTAFIDRSQLRATLIASLLAGLTMGALVAPWVGTLNARYGFPTLSLAPDYIQATTAHDYQPFCYAKELCDQPPDVLFPWEDPDPAIYLPLVVSPFASLTRLLTHLRGLAHNATIWLYSTSRNLLLLNVLALPAAGLMAFLDWPDARRRWVSLWLLMTIGLYTVGYFQSLSGDFRFYYGLVPVLIVLLYLVIDRLAAGWKLPPEQARWAGRLLLLAPLLAYTFHETGYVPEVQLFRPSEHCAVADLDPLAAALVPPFAGVDAHRIDDISYFAQTRTYGLLLSERVSPDEIDRQLRALDVQTVLAPAGGAITTTLIDDYGYRPGVTVTYCGEPLQVLGPPAE